MNKSERFSSETMPFATAATAERSVDAKQLRSSDIAGELTKLRGAAVLPIDSIIPDPNQPRKHFDEKALEDLAESFKEEGQIVPITVVNDRSHHGEYPRYIIDTGERRWRAAKLAGLETLKCVIEKTALSQEQKLVRQYVENHLRQDLNPIEKAKIFQEMLDGCSGIREAAARLKTSRATISRTIALLKLSDEEQLQIVTGEIPPTLAYKLATIDDIDKRKKQAAAFKRGEVTARDAASGRGEPSTSSLKAKTKTIGKFVGEIRGPKTATNNDYIEFLEAWAEALRSDGRSRRAA